MQHARIRLSLSCFASVVAVALLGLGCAKTEDKLGRGLRNITEPIRLGEMRTEVEQTALFEGPDKAYTVGFIRGLNKTLARTGVGVYEIVTAPFPPYDPVFTNYLTVEAQHPASGRPQMLSDPTVGVDTYLGFSGGDIAPFVPGSRFRIFDF
jgi:putative exosortase-associated protein (TIGR04073 family)